MAKTINSQIDIFTSLDKAKKQFDKETSADLLSARNFGNRLDFYVDRSKSALKDWPKLYTLIESK
jgi:hypothetical protein